jgi:hypothetical protein
VTVRAYDYENAIDGNFYQTKWYTVLVYWKYWSLWPGDW